MTTFCFIRHGEMDASLGNTGFYRGFAWNMQTLTEKGAEQIRETAEDPVLHDAELIVTSPYGRALHSAAILSRALDLEIRVETGLHEWLADTETYAYVSDEQARAFYHALTENNGNHPAGEHCTWESADQMKARVTAVLEKYTGYRKVIVVCHGTLMQYVLGIPHPENGQIALLAYGG